MIDVGKVYVLHVKQGYENRLQSIQKQLKRLDMDYSLILDGDIDDITPEILDLYFTGEMKKKYCSHILCIKTYIGL